MNKNVKTLLLSAALSALPALAEAQILVDDSFSDGGRTNGSDSHDVAWFYGANAAPSAASAVDVGGDNRFRLVAPAATLNPLLTGTFTPTEVAVGQTISMTFEFTSTGPANASGIRFGLYNGGGTNQANDIVSNPPAFGTVFQNDVGFSVFAPHQQTGTIQLYNRKVNTVNNAHLIGGASEINEAIVGASGSLAVATNTTSIYTASLGLTRTADGYDYSVSYAGTSFSGSTSISSTTIFDTIGIFSLVGTNQSFTIDNVMVTVIPEPSSVAVFFSLGALGLVAFRRSR